MHDATVASVSKVIAIGYGKTVASLALFERMYNWGRGRPNAK